MPGTKSTTRTNLLPHLRLVKDLLGDWDAWTWMETGLQIYVGRSIFQVSCLGIVARRAFTSRPLASFATARHFRAFVPISTAHVRLRGQNVRTEPERTKTPPPPNTRNTRNARTVSDRWSCWRGVQRERRGFHRDHLWHRIDHRSASPVSPGRTVGFFGSATRRPGEAVVFRP